MGSKFIQETAGYPKKHWN